MRVGLVKFWETLRGMTPRQREAVADVLSTLAAEILKGEHQWCGEHIIEVPE